MDVPKGGTLSVSDRGCAAAEKRSVRDQERKFNTERRMHNLSPVSCHGSENGPLLPPLTAGRRRLSDENRTRPRWSDSALAATASVSKKQIERRSSAASKGQIEVAKLCAT